MSEKVPKRVPTTYKRVLVVNESIDCIRVNLVLQERYSASQAATWHTLSWRTKYPSGKSNRRFYWLNEGGPWKIPAETALDMIRRMEAEGGLDQKYFDQRRTTPFTTLVSSEMHPSDRKDVLDRVTSLDEYWGADPFFVIAFDPNDNWRKVLLVNSDTKMATFRSTTEDPYYTPRRTLREGEGWWLDNSMMDANVQQMRQFLTHLDCFLGQSLS